MSLHPCRASTAVRQRFLWKCRGLNKVSVKGYKTIATVQIPNVAAGSSLIHVISKVLIPRAA